MWCFLYIKEKTLGENYKAAYKLWRERTNVDVKLFLNQKNYFKSKKNISS